MHSVVLSIIIIIIIHYYSSNRFFINNNRVLVTLLIMRTTMIHFDSTHQTLLCLTILHLHFSISTLFSPPFSVSNKQKTTPGVHPESIPSPRNPCAWSASSTPPAFQSALQTIWSASEPPSCCAAKTRSITTHPLKLRDPQHRPLPSVPLCRNRRYRAAKRPECRDRQWPSCRWTQRCLRCGKCDDLSNECKTIEFTVRSMDYETSRLASVDNTSIRTRNSASMQLHKEQSQNHTAWTIVTCTPPFKVIVPPMFMAMKRLPLIPWLWR